MSEIVRLRPSQSTPKPKLQLKLRQQPTPQPAQCIPTPEGSTRSWRKRPNPRGRPRSPRQAKSLFLRGPSELIHVATCAALRSLRRRPLRPPLQQVNLTNRIVAKSVLGSAHLRWHTGVVLATRWERRDGARDWTLRAVHGDVSVVEDFVGCLCLFRTAPGRSVVSERCPQTHLFQNTHASGFLAQKIRGPKRPTHTTQKRNHAEQCSRIRTKKRQLLIS